MSYQTITIQRSENSQTLPSTLPMLGLSAVLLLLGGVIGWQLALQKNRKLLANSPTVTHIFSEDGHIDLAQLRFSQARQWVNYASTFKKSKQYDRAITIYDQGLTNHPNDFNLWHERGRVLALLERFEEAIESYDCAYAINSLQHDLAHERGDALLMLNRYEEAIDSFELCLRFHPQDTHILSDLGYALYKLNRFEEALKVLNSVLQYEQNSPSTARAHYYQIASLQELGALEVALKSSQVAMRYHTEEYLDKQYESLRQKILDVLSVA